MTTPLTTARPLANAPQGPSGATFHKCALQVNPHHYAGGFRGAPAEGDPDAHARNVVAKAVELGIEVLAITDHNNVSGVPAFQAAAAAHGIHVFPGFELTSSEGIHILCLYPQDSRLSTLERFLGQFGIVNTVSSADLSRLDFSEILGRVREQGGVAIAAHVTNENGLFNVLQGQARVHAWQSEDLLAIQIPRLIEDLPDDVRPIVQNKNAAYRRANAADPGQAVAVVNAKDIVKPEDLENSSATCHIKMSQVSIEGLRQAFLDPGSRIRLNPKEGKLAPDQHAELLSLAWEGGFLDGAQISFNPNLNVLVGGRGTGKSTIIESLRSVLDLDAIGDDARKAHDGVVQNVLRNGTKISLRVRVHRPALCEYLIERTIPNPPLVRYEDGRVSNLSPRDVLPRVEVYGQHEISELTKSGEKLTRLLDRFIDRDEALSPRKNELRRELETNRRNLVSTRNDVLHSEERLAALPGLEETLERFRDAGLEGRLQERSLLVREERVLASIPERLSPFHESLESLKRELPIDLVFLSPRALEDLPGKEIIARANEVLARLDADLERVAKELEQSLRSADHGLAAVGAEWAARKDKVQSDYEKILRDLQKSRVDGEEFIRLRRQIEELQPLRERLSLQRRSEKGLTDRRRTLLAEWEDLKAKEFRRLDRAARKVGQKLRDKVQVEVTAAGNRAPLFQILRDEVGGRLSEAIEALAHAQSLSLTHFVELSRDGANALSKAYNISPAQAERLARADPEVLMRIEELDLPPTTAIRLNTASAGDPPNWQVLDELSTGQKATAVLLLLLLESDAPLVVDQPEDDLDNRFITEGVVPRMREEKQRRQFIFSTHNANIPVLGDAELIIGLSASGEAEHGQARIGSGHMGSIDSRPVRELVEEILEGGKDAFERRRRKYGF